MDACDKQENERLNANKRKQIREDFLKPRAFFSGLDQIFKNSYLSSTMNKMIFNPIKGSLNVITGCGSGLGKATLRWFLSKGSGPILGIDRHYETNFVESLNLNSDFKSKLLLKTHDTFGEDVEDSLSEFVKEHGPIDNVINVAGVALAFALYSENSQTTYGEEHIKNLIDFNTVGSFNIVRLASKFMIENCLKTNDRTKPKCIINTSCISTTSPTTGQTFYAGSKAALDSMTLCIARELSPFNIRCNTVNVGYFDTKLLRSSEEKIAEYLSNEVSLCPKKIGQPDEFAHLVQAIAENQMLNGCCIKIDAGAREAIR